MELSVRIPDKKPLMVADGGCGENAGPPVRTGGPWDPGEKPINSGKGRLACEPILNFE